MISIHALLTESDYDTSSLMQCQAKFLSTLSLRRATRTAGVYQAEAFNFYPRSPCGERQLFLGLFQNNQLISIHALLAESDHTILLITVCCLIFLSTLSLRRATALADPLAALSEFLSTLSLRRATFIIFHFNNAFPYFYPRSPCGERRRSRRWRPSPPSNFYPRSPCGERRRSTSAAATGRIISIHALLAESDLPITYCLHMRHAVFLSTLSLRRATF